MRKNERGEHLVTISRLIATFGALVLLMAVAAPLGATDRCANLNGMAVAGNGTVTLAESIPAGPYTAPDGSSYPDLPAFCRVVATLRPTADSDITVEA